MLKSMFVKTALISRYVELVFLVSILTFVTSCNGESTATYPTATNTSQPTATETEIGKEIMATPTATALSTEVGPALLVYQVQQITFQSDRFSLVGDLQIPTSDGMHPVIIMVHGSGGSNQEDGGRYRPIMDRFLRAGYAVFSWDKPGVGESTGTLSNYSEVLFERAYILVAAIDALKTHTAIDPERIGAWGISQGGYVIPLALTMTDDIAFMILISGLAMDSYDQGAYLVSQLAFCAGASLEEAEFIEGVISGVEKATTYLEYLDNVIPLNGNLKIMELGLSRNVIAEDEWTPEERDRPAFFNPIDVIRQTTIPVLAFFGERDRQVDPIQGATTFREALQAAGNQNFHVELIPGVDHVIVNTETGCLSEQANYSRSEWLNYSAIFLDILDAWVVELMDTME